MSGARVSEAPAIQIRHDATHETFEAFVDGRRAGEASYRLAGAVMVMHHTGVDPALQGQGIAAALVQAALAHARAEGLTVRPLCSYVATYLRRHPEERDLLG
jgi:uncharacterized protein